MTLKPIKFLEVRPDTYAALQDHEPVLTLTGYGDDLGPAIQCSCGYAAFDEPFYLHLFGRLDADIMRGLIENADEDRRLVAEWSAVRAAIPDEDNPIRPDRDDERDMIENGEAGA